MNPTLFEKVRQWREHTDGFNQHIGVHVLSIEEGRSTLELALTPQTLNPLGSAHGGAIYALCDAAAGTAAASRGRIAVTVSGNIQYLRPGTAGKRLRAFAKELKAGNKTTVLEVLVQDDAGSDIAFATFTMFYTGKTIEDMQCFTN